MYIDSLMSPLTGIICPIMTTSIYAASHSAVIITGVAICIHLYSSCISYIVLVSALCALIIYCIPGGKHAADASM